MSFNELSVNIVAQNLASAEFSKIAADAGVMAAEISNQRIVVQVENLAIPQITEMAENAQVSFGEVSASAVWMGDNVREASTSFEDMSRRANETAMSLRTFAGGIRSFGMLGMQLTSVAADFGILDRETAKYMRGLLAVITVISTAARVYSFLTLITTGETAAVAVNTTAQTANVSATTASTVATNIKSAATWLATTAQNALNISHATFLALTGIGITVVIAAAAAMAYFASQMNAATSSVQNFNSAAGGLPSSGRSVQRAGEAELYRRGIE
jgi:hypothetical protein